MNEVEWNASDDPTAMLAFMIGHNANLAEGIGAGSMFSDRKLRLFACACCRQVWNLLTDERSRRAVEVAERYADGLATMEEMRDAYHAAEPMLNHPRPTPEERGAIHDACMTCSMDASFAANQCTQYPRACPVVVQAALLRCIFGNPWRPIVIVDKPRGLLSAPKIIADNSIKFRLAWLAWNDGTVRKMAEACYGSVCSRCDGDGKAHGSDRPFEYSGPGTYPGPCPKCKGTPCPFDASLLPLLADMLEDAGCTDPAILGHCRENTEVWQEIRGQSCVVPTIHVRGCWVIDLLLGKE